MSDDSFKNVNWEPDIQKGLDSIKDIKQGIKDDADRRKIDGFNPSDVGQKK